MSWWDYINPFTYLGNAAASVIADGWTAAMLGIWNAGLWLLRLVLGIEDDFLTPDLSQGGPMRGIYPYTFWIAGALVLVLVMVQLGIAGFRRDGQSLARVLIGTAQYVMVCAGWVIYAVAVLAAAGGLTRALMQALLHVDAMDAWAPWTGFDTADITDGTVATVLGVLGFLLVFAAFAHLLVLLARAASLLVLAATGPVTAAGLVWDGGRSWFWKAFRWFHAAAFTPVVMMLMLGLGVQATSHVALSATDTLQGAVGTAVPGVVLILVGAFAPLALFKLLAFVDPGTSSGAAMRAGLTAQGGLQGLLRGGGAGEQGGSSAAADSDPSGRSGGEAATEAATSERFAKTAGGFMGALGGFGQAAAAGLGAAAGAGARAATLGADLTNQMGVGHNTYIPDFSTSRSRGRNNAGPNNDQDNPEINGAGPDPASGDAGGFEMPALQPPVPAPTQPPLSQQGGGPGGGFGGGGGPTPGAGGAGGAAGGGAAAAAPVVPV